ncbi:MAG TPA: outer membrane beta-barrel protein [Burkholderiales bacterium]|nr:outer membrane beta-barrel protein [Burkholderiales bacterium]
MTGSNSTLLAARACIAACLGWMTPATAQQVARVEVAPMVGYQSSLKFDDAAGNARYKLDSTNNVGLVLDFRAAPNSQVELLYSRAKSALAPDDGGPKLADVKVEYYHLGGILVYGNDRVQPFFGATVGATRFAPDAAGLDSDTRFSFGLVGGAKLFLTKHIGLRLEARAFGTEVNSNSAAFCTNGSCRIFYDGSFMWQYAINAGLIAAF